MLQICALPWWHVLQNLWVVCVMSFSRLFQWIVTCWRTRQSCQFQAPVQSVSQVWCTQGKLNDLFSLVMTAGQLSNPMIYIILFMTFCILVKPAFMWPYLTKRPQQIDKETCSKTTNRRLAVWSQNFRSILNHGKCNRKSRIFRWIACWRCWFSSARLG